MAQAPTMMPPPGGAAPLPPMDDAPMDPVAEEKIAVTITQTVLDDQASYKIYAGPKPDEAAEGLEDPEGIQADSIGAALKAAMDILKGTSGGVSPEDNMRRGFESEGGLASKY